MEELLGPAVYRAEDVLEEDTVGAVTGLAWTPAGGSVLIVESLLVPGKGNLILTGYMGDVMKESAKIALSVVRKMCGEECRDVFEKTTYTYMFPKVPCQRMDLQQVLPSPWLYTLPSQGKK